MIGDDSPFFVNQGCRRIPLHAQNKISQVGPTRPERAEAPSPGQRPGYTASSHAPCKGKSFTTSINLNPGIRIFHHIPHDIIPRTLYIPRQTNAWHDALSDCQYIAMFYLQRIG